MTKIVVVDMESLVDGLILYQQERCADCGEPCSFHKNDQCRHVDVEGDESWGPQTFHAQKPLNPLDHEQTK